MEHVFVGSHALKAGLLTRGQLRWQYRATLPDVYVAKDHQTSLHDRTKATWLWSRSRAVIAGRAAAALHGALWVPDDSPIEIIADCTRPPRGVIARNEKIGADEIVVIDGMAVTNAERTALDLARHHERDLAVRHLDALARATGVTAAGVLALADRYPRARGLRRVDAAVELMDGGAQSPRETWLRLLLIDEGFPRPRTQIRISDGFNEAFLDMGWDGPKIGVDYDGVRHQVERTRFVHDIGRNELVDRQGWLDLHVVAEHSRAFVVHRVRDAFARRGWAL